MAERKAKRVKRWSWRVQAYEGKNFHIRVQGDGEKFDELVIGDPCWLHLETMDANVCYLGIGERKWMITIDNKGEPHIGEEYA